MNSLKNKELDDLYATNKELLEACQATLVQFNEFEDYLKKEINEPALTESAYSPFTTHVDFIRNTLENVIAKITH